MTDTALDISLTVNGERVAERVDARKTLVDFLREDLVLTGSHVGCEHGVCGACTVRVNGEIALQCGYCTPGMLVAAQDLLKRGGVPSRDEIREHLSGNYCRCTGYHAIVDAVQAVAQERKKARAGGKT
jgi:carbon-monoxide dehydrogenase small subunit